MKKDIKQIIDKLFTAVFPKRCCICGDVIELDKSLCDECINLPKIKEPVCRYCGFSKADCVCKQHKNKYAAVVAPYYYDGSIIKGIHRLKFQSYSQLAKQMGIAVSQVVQREYCDIEFDCITYVPITASRKRQRGYNQAELIAQSVSNELGIPCRNLLVKPKNTKSQRLQSVQMRKSNVYGAFKLEDNASVDNMTVLLIDDVVTTGATLNEAARALRLAGSDNIYCAVVAVTKIKNAVKIKDRV